MEAPACGTPVVAFPAGALAEIVDPGRTGYLVSDVAEMAEAIHRCRSLRPEVCKREASQRFNLHQMITKYFELYGFLADSSPTCFLPKELNGRCV